VVVQMFWAVERSHRDPKYFPNPEKFDPSRFEGSGPPPFVWVPFGGGPHICLGNEFARTEMMVFLHHIVLNFEWEMVDPHESISIEAMPIFKNCLQLQIRKKED
jgi:cytochrome P450